MSRTYGPEQCRRCGGENPSWSAPSPLWNGVMRGGCIDGDPLFDDIVCASCFMMIAENLGVAAGWRLTPEVVNVPLQTTTPSGRRWDENSFMWREPNGDLNSSASMRDAG